MSTTPDDIDGKAQARPTLVFSHANGFPAGTYRQLFEIWREAGWRVLALDKIGHDERFPVSLNWPQLRDQLLELITTQCAGPVWLVGHSLGGYLSVLAAAHRPEIALGVIMLDSPILPPLLGRAVQIAQLTGLGARFSPGAVSRRRRQHWPDAAAAYQHFASKAAFARWAPGVLQDYVEQATTGTADGVRLSFEREIETRIYDTLPNHIARLLRREPLHCPLAFIGGTQSNELKQVGLRATRRLTAGRISWIEGSHLFPFEQPKQTAAMVVDWISRLDAERQGKAPPHPYNRALPPRPM